MNGYLSASTTKKSDHPPLGCMAVKAYHGVHYQGSSRDRIPVFDHNKTKQQLIEELAELRQRVAEQDAELTKSRERDDDWQRIYHDMPVLIATAGLEGYYRQVNPAFEHILGWSEQESLSRPFMEFIHPDDRGAAGPMFERLRSGETVGNFVDRNLCKDGTYRWIDWVVIPRIDRGICFGIGQDITERKMAEAALQNRHAELERRVEERTAELNAANQRLQDEVNERRTVEATLEAFFDSSTAILNIMDEDLSYIKTDTLTPTYFGLDAQSIVGKSIKELAPAFVDAHGAEIRQVIESGNRLEHLEVASPVPSQPGEVAYWLASYFPVPLPGRKRGLGVVGIDITKHKQARKSLERERQTLRHMLQASDHERQLISYDIHDGLAQELAAAIMQFEVYDALKTSDPARGKAAYDAGVHILGRAHSEARRLINGIRPPILDESGITVAIAHLVLEHANATGPKVEFHSDVEFGRLASILENAVYRIAQEALANALEHSGSERIVVSLVEEHGDLRLGIRDWGVGFDPESVDEGHFGLAGIKERARLLGGECLIESGLGKGTRIRVVLPIVEQ